MQKRSFTETITPPSEAQAEMYRGKIKCQQPLVNGLPCQRKAYYCALPARKFVCGTHVRGVQSQYELPCDPREVEVAADVARRQIALIDLLARQNRQNLRPGCVAVTKLRMRAPHPMKDGHKLILPNAHSRGVFSALSPMKLGPVTADGLPDSINMENWWQFAKVHASDVQRSSSDGVHDWKSGDLLRDREIVLSEDYWLRRRTAYAHEKGMRHKLNAHGAKEKPVYTVFPRRGGWAMYAYIESRALYCREYERLAFARPEYHALVELVRAGMNILIAGYDGYDIGERTVEECYMDPARPFGHELVLYAMVTCAITGDSMNKLPWNTYYEKNKHIYD